MSKPRADAKLLNLPEDQQARLADWLLGGMPFHEARLLVQKEFGMEVRSLSAFSQFWAVVCQPALLSRRRRMNQTAEVRAEEAEKEPGQFDAATIDALKQKAYELAESPHASPKDVKAIMTLLLKAQDYGLKEKQLTLDREKFEFDAVKSIRAQLAELNDIHKSSALDDDEKVQQIRLRVFGSAPR